MVEEIQSTKESWKRSLKSTMLGTLVQMSADLEIRYGAEAVFLDTPDGEKISAYWLPASKRYLDKRGVDIYAQNTMIICNPNMGYAEGQIYNSDWPDFYLDYGINVVLWNYRGYGKSSGIPSPLANRLDSEVVYQFARQQTIKAVNGQRPFKIGVHGISIGGIAATHLGKSGLVDFLFVDRSFLDLLSFPK